MSVDFTFWVEDLPESEPMQKKKSLKSLKGPINYSTKTNTQILQWSP